MLHHLNTDTPQPVCIFLLHIQGMAAVESAVDEFVAKDHSIVELTSVEPVVEEYVVIESTTPLFKGKISTITTKTNTSFLQGKCSPQIQVSSIAS